MRCFCFGSSAWKKRDVTSLGAGSIVNRVVPLIKPSNICASVTPPSPRMRTWREMMPNTWLIHQKLFTGT